MGISDINDMSGSISTYLRYIPKYSGILSGLCMGFEGISMGGSMDIAFVPIGMSGYVGEAVYCWG